MMTVTATVNVGSFAVSETTSSVVIALGGDVVTMRFKYSSVHFYFLSLDDDSSSQQTVIVWAAVNSHFVYICS